jgi:type IV pilus assembly protein PilV
MSSRIHERGFTLLELVAGMAAFAFGMLALYKLQAATVHNNTYSLELAQATTLAQDRMEQLMALAYDAPELTDTDADGTNHDADGDGQDDFGGDFGLDDTTTGAIWTADGPPANNGHAPPASTEKYTVFWNVATNYPLNNTKTVRVIVTWKDRKDREHRSSLDFTRANTL